MKKVRREQYLDSFPHDSAPTSVRRVALEEAREVRKFEIELYWRRAAHFWVFIAAAFGGYFALQEGHQTLSFLVACLGFLFSLAWYFVNRGSKFWQQNWETHVDLLEDKLSGPVYKTVLQRSQSSFCKLNGPYPFSVSKINQLLSLFVTIAWLIPIARTFAIVWGIQSSISPRLTTALILILTFLGAIVLARFGLTDDLDDDVQIDGFYQSKRTYT